MVITEYDKSSDVFQMEELDQEEDRMVDRLEQSACGSSSCQQDSSVTMVTTKPPRPLLASRRTRSFSESKLAVGGGVRGRPRGGASSFCRPFSDQGQRVAMKPVDCKEGWVTDVFMRDGK